LGTAQSEGCVRIPALLNEFIDRYGILDEDYDRAVANGGHLWLLRADRAPTPWSGQFLVVVESSDSTRPVWSPLPGKSLR
ncbi:MAG: murein L,D-transpeptidase, partial [Pseudomonadota bacterium]|nr:murein L,D-transpeptidase [Pseudomonadota bacterium]